MALKLQRLASFSLCFCVGMACVIGCDADPAAEGTASSNEDIAAFVKSNPKYAEEAKTTNRVPAPIAQKPGQPNEATSGSTLTLEN